MCWGGVLLRGWFGLDGVYIEWNMTLFFFFSALDSGIEFNIRCSLRYAAAIASLLIHDHFFSPLFISPSSLVY